jgi:hypothetical protein
MTTLMMAMATETMQEEKAAGKMLEMARRKLRQIPREAPIRS